MKEGSFYLLVWAGIFVFGALFGDFPTDGWRLGLAISFWGVLLFGCSKLNEREESYGTKD